MEDHHHFRAITFVEPGGVRLALATTGTGVPVNYGAAAGTRLTLPPWLEHRRAQLQGVLPSLHLPHAPGPSNAS